MWVLDGKKACGIVIQAIPPKALCSDGSERLMGYCGVKNDWEGPRFGFSGEVSIIFGMSPSRSVEKLDSCLMLDVAEESWPDTAVPRVLAKGGCLLQNRLAGGKHTPVFAALTNGFMFRFFSIDVDCVVNSSGIYLLQVGDDGHINIYLQINALKIFNTLP